MGPQILVLCTGNSARSQMAEGFFRHFASSAEVQSAGTRPKGLNPLAVTAMQEVGIDISRQESKDVARFSGRKFDWVITVCDSAKEQCPVFPGSRTIHWSLHDPEDLESFRSVRDDLRNRICEFLKRENLLREDAG